MQQARKVAAANNKRHDLVAQTLRRLVMTDLYPRRFKESDTSDFEAVKEVLHDRVAKMKQRKSTYAAYYEQKTRFYIERKPKEHEYSQAVAADMGRNRKPVKHRFVLARE